MKKKSIFTKIDELYTAATKVIIGDMPLDGTPEAKEKEKKLANTKKKTLKEKFNTVKNTLLNLGKPSDEKSLLYDEVIKQEKKEKKLSKKSVTKTKTAPAKKKQSNNKDTKAIKTTTKKKTASTSKGPEKKTVAKKSTPKTKATPTKKTTTKATVSTAKSSDTKKASNTKTSNTNITTKKATPKKSTINKVKNDKKTTSSKNASSLPRGAKKAEKIALYIKDIKKHYGEVDEAFVAIIVKNLGPSIYKADAELVSCSDPKELDTVRKNFLVKKLGIDASKGVLDAAIQDVCSELKGVRKKYRATFYYTLAKKFKKESVLS